MSAPLGSDQKRMDQWDGEPQRDGLTPRQRQELACRLRLADGRTQRWAWAIGSSLPVLGLPVLVWHARSRRTLLPLLFGITMMATAAFAFLTVVAALERPGQQSRGNDHAPLAVILAGMASFAFGHRLGQDRSAQNALKWLQLDR